MSNDVVVKVYDDFEFINLEKNLPEDDIVIGYVDNDYILSVEVDTGPVILDEYENSPIVIDVNPFIQHVSYGNSTPQNVNFTYNPEGQVATSLKGGVLTTFSYNAEGQVSTISNVNYTKTFTYNAEGLVEAITIT